MVAVVASKGLFTPGPPNENFLRHAHALEEMLVGEDAHYMHTRSPDGSMKPKNELLDLRRLLGCITFDADGNCIPVHYCCVKDHGGK